MNYASIVLFILVGALGVFLVRCMARIADLHGRVALLEAHLRARAGAVYVDKD